MQELEIKAFYSPDVPNLQTFAPAHNEDVYFLLEILVGVKGEKPADIFSAIVATPQSIRTHHVHIKTTKTKYILVAPYNWEALKTKLEHIVTLCNCHSFASSTEKLRHYFNWEYE